MKYRAHAERAAGERWWGIVVEEEPRVLSQARRLDQVPAMAADALSLWFEREVSPSDIEVVPHIKGLDDLVAAAQEAREESERVTERAGMTMRRAAVEAIDIGLTVRDVGELLGVSYQRAAVLAREGRELQDA